MANNHVFFKSFLLILSSISTCDGQTFEKLNPSVVKIVYGCSSLSKAKTGTGFLWKSNNHVITALHLVTGCGNGNIYIYYPSNKKSEGKNNYYAAKIIKVLREADIALLEVEKLPDDCKPIYEFNSSTNAKETVYALGYPLGVASKRSVELKIPFNETKTLSTNIPP